MSAQETRPALLQRLKDPNDAQAWREFDLCYRDLVLRYCRRLGLQEADAEDVRQLVMLGLTQSMRAFAYDQSRGRFRHYLRRVVHNALNRYMARAAQGAVRLETTLGQGLPDLADPDIERAWRDEWVRHHYRRAMEAIRARYEPRSLQMFDRLVDGRTVTETAQEFGVSVAAVYKLQTRIRDHLRAQIARQVADEDDRHGLA
ncbi:MAG: sigma-70 family RNA polymerase sigma factor [Planctomycetota bacterium]